jgi:DNA polymerase-3 subunit alpha
MKELLFLEKESSGMYFSGHMFDSFSHHADSLKLDSIADILAAFDEDTSPEEAKYSDDDSVRIAGIISAKRTKTVKNGDQMCFIELEDRYSEIEVIIFPKQYSSVSRDVSLEAAAVIEGRISEEDGASPKIILSNLRLLKSNNEFDKEELRRPKNAPRIYIKLPSIADGRTASITRLAMLNRGECEDVLFDSSTKKYSVMKGTLISQSDKVRNRLCELFGEENVVIK